MKALLFDVGNTRLKWGVATDGEIGRTGHVSLKRLNDSGFAALTTRLPRRIDQVMASNVAGPSFGARLAAVIGIHCGRELRFAKTERTAHGVTNAYRRPRQLGVDRWVAMIGAWAEFESACVVVDAGTAVTIDVLDDQGMHLGGQILPGVSLMAQALSGETSDIGPVARRIKGTASGLTMFAHSTAAAVQNGAWNAVTGAVERAINALRSNAYDPVVVLTGGDGSRMLDALSETPQWRPDLVLQGLLHILESRQ